MLQTSTHTFFPRRDEFGRFISFASVPALDISARVEADLLRSVCIQSKASRVLSVLCCVSWCYFMHFLQSTVPLNSLDTSACTLLTLAPHWVHTNDSASMVALTVFGLASSFRDNLCGLHLLGFNFHRLLNNYRSIQLLTVLEIRIYWFTVV